MIYYFVWLHLLFHSGGKYKSLTAKKLGESTLAEFRKRLLSINNIGGSFSSGIIGSNSYFVGVFSAVVSFVALWSGNYLTVFLNRYNIENKAIILYGTILIIIGAKQIL
ncbi:hypothetical protein CLMAG_35570 [Clostridium magnum DSM 2767]|uniref:Uncharacterized protein n=1 Tax=Clostridium magnum DSM 2767 TaxID=1121326 RepID=A0A162S1J4_9CLOT|nr:hypothetical protein CLMAG_35570 [Clostridium magnum DSM 2767]SHI38825.1 hypothetical protein SAMN02745944_04223 [Clostridium magnum DSM 2767]